MSLRGGTAGPTEKLLLLCALAAAILAVLLGAGCARRVEPPERPATITGVVEHMARPSEDGTMVVMKVYGAPVKGERLGSAIVRVPRDAYVLEGGRRAADLSDDARIREGAEVMVWCDDFAFSCPPKVRAALVLVLDYGRS